MEDLHQQPRLPVEILLQILEVLLQKHDRWSLSRLCLCSKEFQRLVEPILYQRYSISLNTHMASSSYLSIRARNSSHVRDIKILAHGQNMPSSQFQEPPMELLCNVQRLKLFISSDILPGKETYNRIWDTLTRIPSGALRSFRYCPRVMLTGNMLVKLCDSLRTQFEIQELSFGSDWDVSFDISIERDLLTARFPKLRIVEGTSGIQDGHPNITHFWGTYPIYYRSDEPQPFRFNQVVFLRICELNRYSIQILEELVQCYPNLEVLGVFKFYADGRRMPVMVSKGGSERS
jgi:hypothetical protein